MLKFCSKFLLLTFALVVAATTRAATGNPTPILVELFTSEGCSDCPPADTFLRALDSTQPVPGAELIVLEEHVDYWDDGGWRDPFSSHAFTVRQGDYVSRMHLASAYTPQMVVDGAYQFVGSDRRSAAKAFDGARSIQKIGIRIASLRVENGTLRAHVEIDVVPSKADVFVALVADHAESQVARGENGGRHLQHVAIARNLTTVGKATKGESLSKDITLNAKSAPEQGRLIVFLQEPNQGKILGAAVERFKP